MYSAPWVRSATTAMLAFALPVAAGASEPDLEGFRSEIDAFINRLGTSSNGLVKWAGSNPYAIRRDGDALVAVIDNARLSLETEHPGQIALDRLEIRQIGHSEEGGLTALALMLPEAMTLVEGDGTQTKITLKGASAKAVVEAGTGRGRDTTIEISSAHIDQPSSGAWVKIGPLLITSKLVAEPKGGWTRPVEFAAKEIEYFLPHGPVGGEIERIEFRGMSAGPSLAELENLREAIDRSQTDDRWSPALRDRAFLATLSTIGAPFSMIRGELMLDGLAVRGVTGEALVAVARAGAEAEITGLDHESASVRLNIHHEGLDLAPSILEQTKVPRRIVVDLGLGGLSTRALSKTLRALETMAAKDSAGEDQNQLKQQALAQVLAAVATLSPTFHIYDAAIDTVDFGVELTAEAKGSPFALADYSVSGDLTVRDFDAIAKSSSGLPFAEYLPILKEIGVDEKGADGTPRIGFHLASAPPKWITINGNDVGAWFDRAEPEAAQPRLLNLSDPPIKGSDVRSVQRALAAAKIPVELDGVYSSSTAAAVAHFQKLHGLNVSGVVDAETRQRLGAAPEAPREDGRN
jgi:hypothetical protein